MNYFATMDNASQEVLLSATNFFQDADISSERMFLSNHTDIELYGPKRDSLYVVIPITVIYVVIFITGLIGNISTCIVISKNRTMHTATNYYLFSLAISDLLLLVSGLPQEVYSIWSRYPYVFGHTFCVLRGLFAEMSANATVLTITAFTVERYVAICHPFLSHTMSKLSRAVKFILCIWIVAIAFAIPQALQFGLTQDNKMCYVVHQIVTHSFEVSTFMFFIAPMTLISVLYALIGFRLRTSNMMKRNSTEEMQRKGCKNGQVQTSKRVLKMLGKYILLLYNVLSARYKFQTNQGFISKLSYKLTKYCIILLKKTFKNSNSIIKKQNC